MVTAFSLSERVSAASNYRGRITVCDYDLRGARPHGSRGALGIHRNDFGCVGGIRGEGGAREANLRAIGERAEHAQVHIVADVAGSSGGGGGLPLQRAVRPLDRDRDPFGADSVARMSDTQRRESARPEIDL